MIQVSRSRALLLVGAIATLALLAAQLLQPAGELQAQAAVTAEPAGEIQIDELSLASPISQSDFAVTLAISDAGGGGGAGKATFDPVVVQRDIDSDSPALMRSVATGIPLDTVIVRVYKPGTTKTLVTYRLDNANLVGVDQSGKSEKLMIKYRVITMTSGGKSACFDLAGNVTC